MPNWPRKGEFITKHQLANRFAFEPRGWEVRGYAPAPPGQNDTWAIWVTLSGGHLGPKYNDTWIQSRDDESPLADIPDVNDDRFLRWISRLDMTLESAALRGLVGARKRMLFTRRDKADPRFRCEGHAEVISMNQEIIRSRSVVTKIIWRLSGAR